MMYMRLALSQSVNDISIISKSPSKVTGMVKMSAKRSKAEKREKVAVPAEMFACLDDKGKNYLIEIELPGVEKKDIELTMQEDLVSVKAEREAQVLLGHMHFPLKVNPTKAEAVFKQGLLSVTVPVKEKRAPATSVKIK